MRRLSRFFIDFEYRTMPSRNGSLRPSRTLITCLAAALMFLQSTQAARAQTAVSPTEYSLLPREQGFELRAHGQVLGYGSDGSFLGARADAFIETPLSNARPSQVWVAALPAQAGFDPVVMVQRRTQTCTRVRMEDGRSLIRVTSVPPAPPEITFLPPPGTPQPTPPGSLGWADDRRDSAHAAGLLARDNQGLIYALDWRFAQTATFSMRTYAPDCRPLGEVHTVRAFDAHAARPGVFVVSPRTPGFTLSLSRYVAGQMDWDIDLAAALQLSPGSIAHPWLRALEDGSLLLAGAGTQSENLELALFDESGQVQLRAQLPGRSIAALREQGDSLLLALGDRVDRAGANRLVELDRRLQVRRIVELQEGFVLGPVSSSSAGLRGEDWLVHEGDYAVRAGERSGSSRWGVLRFQPGGHIEWHLPMGELRPRLRLANDELLVSRFAEGVTDLATLREGSEPQWLHAPRVAQSESISPPVQAALDDGRVARMWWRGGTRELALQREGQTLWRRTLDDVPNFGASSLYAEVEAGRVCVAEYGTGSGDVEYALLCYRAVDGTALPTVRWQGQRFPRDRHRGGLDAHGSASLFLGYWSGSANNLVRHLRASADGSSPISTVIPVPAESMCAPRSVSSRPGVGAAVVERADDGYFLRGYAPSGDLLWRHALPSGLHCPGVLAIADDGEVLVGDFGVGPDADVKLHEVLVVSESQPLRWRSDLRALGLSALGADVEATRWLEVSDTEHWAGIESQGGKDAVLLLDRAGGQVIDLLHPTLGAIGAAHWELANTSRPGELLLFLREASRAYARRLHVPDLRIGPPAQMELPWSTQARSALRVGDSLEAVKLAADSAEPSNWSALSAPPLAEDLPLGAEHSGLWYDPQITGQGLMLDVEASTQRWFAAWFTFQESVESASSGVAARHEGLAWYSMLGQGSPSAGIRLDGTLYATFNGRFDGGAPLTAVSGATRLRAIDCNTIEFQYRFEPARPRLASATIGARRLRRLGPPPPSCGGTSLEEQAGLTRASTGSWVLEGRPGQGVLMQIDPGAEGQSGSLWGAWFGFAPTPDAEPGRQHWLTLTGRAAAGQPGVAQLEWMRTTGGLLDELSTSNSHVIGTGRLRFTACDRAVLEYSFDVPGLAGDAFARVQGQVNLRRFDPCS
jgi:hypothetical protein